MAQRAVRVAFALVAWLFVIAIVYQVFLAGVGLFVPGVDTFSYHRDFGWLLQLGPLPLLLLAWAAGAGRSTVWLGAALVVLVPLQPLLAWARLDLPFLAALHPVNAVAIFWLAATITRRATARARQPIPTAAAAAA
jgi:hypothetical protein